MQPKPSGTTPDPARHSGPDNENARDFVPPEGWTRSENRSTSPFAFEMSNTTRYYANDGSGTGYFAPGWSAQRLARKTGVFRQIALVLAVLIVAGGGSWIHHAYETRDEYAWLEANGVETTATVDEVTVEHETDRYHYRNSSAGWDYITRTSAQISYEAAGGATEGTVTESRTQKKSFPDPEWTTGESLQLYVDPHNANRFVLFEESRERDLFRDVPLEVKIALRGDRGPADLAAFPVHHGPAERPGSPEALSRLPRQP